MSAPEAACFLARVAGAEHSHECSEGLIAVEVEDAEDCVGEAVLTLDPHLHDPPTLGAPMSVAIFGEAVFDGFVSGWRWTLRDGLPTLAVVGSDARARLAAGRRTRTFEGVDERAAARRVLEEARVDVGGVCALGPASEHLWQREESDLAFLQRLARRRGSRVRVRGGKVHIEPEARDIEGLGLGADDVLSLDLEASLLDQADAFVARAWSADRGRLVEVHATPADLRGHGVGDSALTLASGAGMGRFELADLPSAVPSDVAGAARLALRERACRLLEGSVTLRGRPGIGVGQDVALRGFGPRLDVQGWIARVRHEIAPGGPPITTLWLCSDRLPG